MGCFARRPTTTTTKKKTRVPQSSIEILLLSCKLFEENRFLGIPVTNPKVQLDIVRILVNKQGQACGQRTRRQFSLVDL